MNLHNPGNKPDWELKTSKKSSVWHQIAIATNGVLTPGNIISLSGLLLVIWGAHKIYYGEWQLGLVVVIIGRLFDLVDGVVAERTKTKSQLGELVDTTCDKLSVLVILVVTYSSDSINLVLFGFLALHHLYMSLFGVTFGRRYHLHTNQIGKLAMFFSWVAISAAILSTKLPHVITTSLAIAISIAYISVAIFAMYSYYLDLQQAIVDRMKAARWIKEVDSVVFMFNPKATNFNRSKRWKNALTKRLEIEAEEFNITKHKAEALDRISQLGKKHTILVLVAGGDGTVHSVVNGLMEIEDKNNPNIYVMPLWGGNANDFSYMLNGLASATTPQRILAQSAAVPVPLIKLTLDHSDETRTIYACCYASFGASAYAARELDSKRISTDKITRWLPPLIILREAIAVAKALAAAPTNRAEIDDSERKFYEHSLINGSRIAKVNRVPIELHEPIFFHAVVENKDPSLLINLARIMRGKPDTTYTKRSSLTFTVKDGVDAQVDGEVLKIKADTKISARIYEGNLRFIATRLPD